MQFGARPDAHDPSVSMPMSKHHPRNPSAQPGTSPQAARTVQHATQYGQRTRLAGTLIERGGAPAIRSFVGRLVSLGQYPNLRVASVAWGSSDGRGYCGRAWTIDDTVGVACEGYEGDVDPRRAFPDNRPHSKSALSGFSELASHKTQQQGTEGFGGKASTEGCSQEG